LQEGDNGETVLFNNKTGETKAPPGNVHPKGSYVKGAGSGQKAMEYAKQYGDSGDFTGPGDEALMEQFFSIAKPESGFRDSRSWMQSAEGIAHHALFGTWFTDEQRANIVSTMNNLERAQAAAHPEQKPPTAAGNSPKEGATKVNSSGDKVKFYQGKWVPE
jgi:hypothetical protein